MVFNKTQARPGQKEKYRFKLGEGQIGERALVSRDSKSTKSRQPTAT